MLKFLKTDKSMNLLIEISYTFNSPMERPGEEVVVSWEITEEGEVVFRKVK